MFDIRHKSVSPREVFWISVFYVAVIVVLVVLGVKLGVRERPLTAANGEDAAVSKAIPVTPARLARVVTHFPACPMRSDLVAAMWQLVQHPDDPAHIDAKAYLRDHGCFDLEVGEPVMIAGEKRETWCIMLTDGTRPGCYWTAKTAVEE